MSDFLGGLSDFFFGDPTPQFDAVPGTGQGEQFLVDPGGFTQTAFGSLTDLTNLGRQGLLGTQIGQVQTDPNAAFRQFIGQAPALQGLALGATSDLERALQRQTQDFTRQAAQQTAAEFSGLGALFSGATRDVASRRAAEAAERAATQLGSQQIGLAQSLLGQGFGAAQGAQQQALQAQLANQQARLSQFGTFANLLGQGTGQLAGFGAPVIGSQQFVAREPDKGFVGGVGEVGQALSPFISIAGSAAAGGA